MPERISRKHNYECYTKENEIEQNITKNMDMEVFEEEVNIIFNMVKEKVNSVLKNEINSMPFLHFQLEN